MKNSKSTFAVFGQLMKNNKRQYSMFIALFVIMIAFEILTKGIFLEARNLSNLYLQTAYTAVLATGMVLVIVAKHIDLSVGSIAGFTGAIAGILQVHYHLNTPLTIILVLCAGALIGIWQGFWIAYKTIPSFIVTLAGMLIFRGAVIGITQGETIGPFHKSFKLLGSGTIPSLGHINGMTLSSLVLGALAILFLIAFEIKKRNTRKKYGFDLIPTVLFVGKLITVSVLIGLFIFSMANYRGIPYAVLIVVGLVGLYTFITSKTVLGRHIYAVGGNSEAAEYSGIRSKRVVFLIFVSMGILAALCGVLFSARMNSAAPSAGNLFELNAIAAAFIGGASAYGGIGTIIGGIVGALVMSSINNGMSLMNIDASYQYIVKGLVLLLAVWFDLSSRRKGK